MQSHSQDMQQQTMRSSSSSSSNNNNDDQDDREHNNSSDDVDDDTTGSLPLQQQQQQTGGDTIEATNLHGKSIHTVVVGGTTCLFRAEVSRVFGLESVARSTFRRTYKQSGLQTTAVTPAVLAAAKARGIVKPTATQAHLSSLADVEATLRWLQDLVNGTGRLLLLLSCRYLHFHIARQRGQRHGPRRPPRHSTLGPAHAPGFCTTGRGQQRELPGLRGRGRQLGGVISVLLGGGPLRLLTVVVRCSPPRPRTSAFP